MTCPFCAEDGFDAPGLAGHLRWYTCEKYEDAWTEFCGWKRETAELADKKREGGKEGA